MTLNLTTESSTKKSSPTKKSGKTKPKANSEFPESVKSSQESKTESKPESKPRRSKRIQGESVSNDSKLISCPSEKNLGESGELIVVTTLLQLSKSSEPNDIEKLVRLLGPDANQGIILYNIYKSANKSSSTVLDESIDSDKSESDNSENSDNSDNSDNSNNSFSCEISDEFELVELTDESQIGKSPSKSKADCVVKLKSNNKMLYISIKCMNGGKPSVLNHTPRCAKVFSSGGYLHSELDNLDKLIKIMNEKRTKGEVKEEINISQQIPSIQNEHTDIYKSIIKLMSYFIFEGTGSSKSDNPANSILKVHIPTDISKWEFFMCDSDVEKHDYVMSIYSKLCFSLVNKAMPKNLHKTESKEKYETCAPWIYKDKTKEKGCLHVRIQK
jgi:hypothetical protein